MGTVPVTYPTFPGLRIALRVRISNAEAHADMYVTYPHARKAHEVLLYKSRRHLPLPCLLLVLQSCEVWKRRNKTSSKRLSYMSVAHPFESAWVTRQIYDIFIDVYALKGKYSWKKFPTNSFWVLSTGTLVTPRKDSSPLAVPHWERNVALLCR